MASVLAHAINTLAPKFLEDLEADNVSQNLLRGSVSLQNLTVNRRVLEDVLQNFLPIKLCHVHIDTVEIQLPTLLRRRITVNITGITAAVCLKHHAEWAQWERQIVQVKNRQKLRALVLQEGGLLFGGSKPVLKVLLGRMATLMVPRVEVRVFL